jgi:hypothetical protein
MDLLISLQSGLFSTILTAFIAASITWLQEDYTQTTAALLEQISLQLANDSLRKIPAQRPNFEIAVTDIVINVLWFLSLGFSLAAALFGVIVKRWLREYSMWQLEPPQDAIPLRQIRYEAFMQWEVPLIVALLPGLLEIAIILFMVGISVMLWTLQTLLALVVTLFSIIFLVIAFYAVVLPVFFPHCPYRSPAGWACVLLWDSLCRVYIRATWMSGKTTSFSRSAHRERFARHVRTRDWKQRDLYLDGASKLKWEPCLDAETTKLIHLVDALAWTYERCQDDSIMDVQYHFSTHTTEAEIGISTLLTVIHAICRKFSLDPLTLFDTLHRQYVHHVAEEQSEKVVLSFADTPDVLNPWDVPNGIISLELFGRFLLTEAQIFYNSVPTSSSSTPYRRDFSIFIDALCFLYHIVKMTGSVSFKRRCADFLMDLYRSSFREEEGPPASKLAGLRTVAVQILRKIGSIHITGFTISGKVF